MSEKTQEPTAKRLRKAREDGQVARSAEFSGAVVLLTALTVVWTSGGHFILQWGVFVNRVATVPRVSQSAPEVLNEGMWLMALWLAPLLSAVFVSAFLVSLVQVGASFSVAPIMPRLEKMNPAEGLKRLVGKDRWFQLGQNMAKLGTIGAVAVFEYRSVVPGLAELAMSQSVFHAGSALGQTTAGVGLKLVLVLALFGGIDFVWQRYRHRQGLMMTWEEVKSEFKDAEGDPQMKSKRKRLHQEILREGAIADIRRADAVVVNPTHLAAALRYDQDEGGAPRVVARGRGGQAKRIREEAERCGVPIVRDVPLARALMEVEFGAEIPEDLYEAVAAVLHYVYSLRERSDGHG